MEIKIKNFFNNFKIDKNSITFLSIGSASNITIGGYKKHDFMIGNNNHQFPPFLLNFYNNNSNYKLNILLLDDRLEYPPYIINNFGLKDYFKKDEYIKNKWSSKNISVIAMYELFDENVDKLFVKKLCEKIDKKKGTFIFHDFSGYNFHKKMGLLYQSKFDINYIKFSITIDKNLDHYFLENNSKYMFKDAYPKLNNYNYKIKFKRNENNRWKII